MTTFNNDSLKHELASEFLRRNDLVNRWGNIISSYLALPGLRFFAPMSVVGASGQAVDLALGNNLSNNNNAQFSYLSLQPFCAYNGSTEYHSITDNAAHDIIGSEAYIGSSVRGLTMGMWVQARDLPGVSSRRLFSKGTTTGNARAYALRQGSDVWTFGVSGTGANDFPASDDTEFIVDTWYFLAGRFDPSTEVKLYVGRSTGITSFTNTSSIPATLNNSATGLAVGGQADGTGFSNIRASMCFISAMALDDHFIFSLFEQSRIPFGI